ncbi:uncharacterized protein LOC123397006 [Hordeum vulgare subsp. vulgare]|uniref:uncharacterized protein LOC123397006 n=1 Tax=Hordeum vulgare subsp. vulgare TaxID=112509 RepID=UPI001D1A3856|nr:uncharacterized protein LOC123397006 [Hordeum vulgare subsp. vulgare]
MQMVKYASYNGQREAASKAVDFCLRALEDFDLALHGSPSEPSASVEVMRSKISDVIQTLDNIMQLVPSTLIRKERMLGDASDQRRSKATSETCEKPIETKNTFRGWLQVFKPIHQERYQRRRRWRKASREQRAVVDTNDTPDKWQQGKFKHGNSRREKAVVPGGWLLSFFFLISMVLVMSSSHCYVTESVSY